MIRRRLMVIGGAGAVVIAGSVAAALLLTGGPASHGSVAARTPALALQPASERAQRAMQALDAPSLPQPLPGSESTSRNGYLIAGTCADAQANYMATGAPLPAGTKAQAAGASALAVEGSYGVSAIVFKDGQTGCYYWIYARPTVVVQGKGSAPSGSGVAQVGCFLPVDQGGSETTVVAIAGKSYVISIGPTGGSSLSQKYDPSKGQSVLLFQGAFTDLPSDPTAGSAPDPAVFGGKGGVYPATVVNDDDGGITATLTGGDAAGTVINVICTSDVTSILPAKP